VSALSTECPLGSTASEWDEHPERFPSAAARPWHGPFFRYDAEEHEVSADARRISREMLIDVRAGRLNAKLLRRSLGTRFKLERVLERAAELYY
jgi:hypothetical protein